MYEDNLWLNCFWKSLKLDVVFWHEIETFLGNEMYDTLINKWNKELSEKTYFDLMDNLYWPIIMTMFKYKGTKEQSLINQNQSKFNFENLKSFTKIPRLDHLIVINYILRNLKQESYIINPSFAEVKLIWMTSLWVVKYRSQLSYSIVNSKEHIHMKRS